MTLEGDASFGAPTFNVGDPVEIKVKIGDGEAFPLDALPPRLRKAIQAIVDIVQVPVSIAGQAVLAACALVAQTRINVVMPTGEVVPVSIYMATIATSGDRKSSCDKRALQAVYEYEKELRKAFVALEQEFRIAKAAYDAALAKAKSAGGKDRNQVQANMEECGKPPTPPALPMLLVEEPTIEGITKLLDEAYPAIGLFSDEGARMVGGYSMQDERQAATGAALSQLWDGKPIKRVRGTDVTKILDGRRMSLHLMMQPGVANKLFGNKELRDQGMMSRLLVAYPKSLKGERMWKEAPPSAYTDLEEFHARMRKALQNAFIRVDPETRELEFDQVELQPEARAMWIAFSDMLERQQGKDQPLAEVSDIASKMAQHALRLAAVLSYFEGGQAAVREGISATAMRAGIALGEFYLSEALRLFNVATIDTETENADTLIEFIRKEQLETVGRRWLQQNGPRKVCGTAKVYGNALEMLVQHGHLVEVRGAAHFSARGKTYRERNCYTVIYSEPPR